MYSYLYSWSLGYGNYSELFVNYIVHLSSIKRVFCGVFNQFHLIEIILKKIIPQDSVSTNSTTIAFLIRVELYRNFFKNQLFYKYINLQNNPMKNFTKCDNTNKKRFVYEKNYCINEYGWTK